MLQIDEIALVSWSGKCNITDLLGLIQYGISMSFWVFDFQMLYYVFLSNKRNQNFKCYFP